jgi:hypothetical protein
MFSNNPKELRAMARKLNAMASALELQQDPQKFIKKKINSQVNGLKRKAKTQIAKKLGL